MSVATRTDKGEVWVITPTGSLMRFVTRSCDIESNDTPSGWTYSVVADHADLISVHRIGREGVEKLIEQLAKWLALFDTLAK